MLITKSSPDTWQELESEVASVLSQCGFDTRRKYLVEGRGTTELDVYAEEVIDGRKNIIVCECKHWSSRVPQAVVHSFRTVMQEVGANTGYIISTGGFQSGAYQAIERTNVHLVDWEEFQEVFHKTWYHQYLIKEIVYRYDRLIGFSEPFAPRWLDDISEEDAEWFVGFRNQNMLLWSLLMSFTPWHHTLPNRSIRDLPIRSWSKESYDDNNLPDNVLDSLAHRDLLDAIESHCSPAINKINEMFSKYDLPTIQRDETRL
ncbi:MAG: restriction endonuclease [Pseudomonadota bacterium]